jgi:hypothetical protein
VVIEEFLHGEEASFPTLFPAHGLGGGPARDGLTIIQPLCNGTITNPA